MNSKFLLDCWEMFLRERIATDDRMLCDLQIPGIFLIRLGR